MHFATYIARLQASIDPRVLGHDFSHVFTCCCSLIIFLYVLRELSKGQRQKLIAGIPIVGGNDAKSIKLNREKFRTQAKEMLLEGYEQVRVNLPLPTRPTAS